MGNQVDGFDGDEFEDGDEQQPRKGSGLRDRLEDALREKKRLADELDAMKVQVRAATVSKVLESHGVNPKVAAFIPSTVEGEEAIAGWLAENADLFGVSVGGQEPQETRPAVPAEVQDASRRLQTFNTQPAGATITDQFASRIANAKTKQELDVIWGEIAGVAGR